MNERETLDSINAPHNIKNEKKKLENRIKYPNKQNERITIQKSMRGMGWETCVYIKNRVLL